LQAEYFVPRANAVEAMKAVETLRHDIRPVLMITEIRSIESDNLWMSPCYHQPSIAIHFTLKQDFDGVGALLPKIEEKLAPFGAATLATMIAPGPFNRHECKDFQHW
jgi:xylitol oxidase